MEMSNEWDSESEDESVGSVSIDNEVQFKEGEYQFTADEPIPDLPTSNLLISEKELNLFIRENFLCKLCHFRIKVGCASSIFWECCNPACDASDKIIPKKAIQIVSETYQRWHLDVLACLGDYEINRQGDVDDGRRVGRTGVGQGLQHFLRTSGVRRRSTN
jgi:hypothetical protein